MKKLLTLLLIPTATFQAFAQNTTKHSDSVESDSVHLGQIIFPILFMALLVFMLVTLIKYFLDFRLKNKLIERGMSEQLSAYILDKNVQEKQNEVLKFALLFCGIGLGLTLIYFTGPIDLHSIAIMAFSLGLSYLGYFFYLRK